MKLRLVLLVAVLGGASCSVTETGSIALIWNMDDPDPFSEPDAAPPASILISAVSVQSADGGSSGDAAIPLLQSPYQGSGTLTLPSQDGYDIDILQATLFDSADAAIIFGRSVPVQLGGIQNTTLDLFVQRTGQFAHLPQPFVTAPVSPLALTFANQYILVADGSGKAGATGNAIYDMSAWAFIQSTLPLPCAPLSIAPLGGTLILILCDASTSTTSTCSGSGVIACGFDTAGIVTTQTQAAPPTCGWDSVAGGATVVGANAESFIVGGTRPANPTNCVVRVGEAETIADAGFFGAPVAEGTFSAMRTGAAAAWSSTRGLVIAGGNQRSNDLPVEYFGTDPASDAGMLPAPSHPGYLIGDLAKGSGAAVVSAGGTLVVAGGTLPDGGVAGVRAFDLTCSDGCDSEVGVDAGSEAGADAGADANDDEAEVDASGDADEEGGAIASVDLGSAQGFAVTPSSALFVGAAGARAGGETRAFLVSTSGTSVKGVKGVPLRLSTRKDTTAVVSPVGSVVVIGGDTTMESFVP
jgi:hypothetical protein